MSSVVVACHACLRWHVVHVFPMSGKKEGGWLLCPIKLPMPVCHLILVYIAYVNVKVIHACHYNSEIWALLCPSLPIAPRKKESYPRQSGAGGMGQGGLGAGRHVPATPSFPNISIL